MLCAFKQCPLEVNSNGKLKQEHLECSLQPLKTASLPEWLWPPKLAGCCLTHTFLKSRDKLKTFYLCYQSAYGHQTWQNCNLWWWAPIHKVTWHFEYVILKNYVTNWNYVSLTKVPMVNNFFWGDGNSPGWALTHKVTWPFNHEVLQNHVTN